MFGGKLRAGLERVGGYCAYLYFGRFAHYLAGSFVRCGVYVVLGIAQKCRKSPSKYFFTHKCLCVIYCLLLPMISEARLR